MEKVLDRISLVLVVMFGFIVIYGLGFWIIPLVLWFNRGLIVDGIKRVLLFYAYKRDIQIKSERV